MIKHQLAGIILLSLQLIYYIQPQLIVFNQFHLLLKDQLTFHYDIHVVWSLSRFEKHISRPKQSQVGSFATSAKLIKGQIGKKRDIKESSLNEVLNISFVLFLGHIYPYVMNFQVARISESFEINSLILNIKNYLLCCTFLTKKPIFHELMLAFAHNQASCDYNEGMILKLLHYVVGDNLLAMGFKQFNRRS